MNQSTHIHPRHPGRHRPLLLVLVGVLTFSALAFSAAFQPNDEVHLTRDTPLLFLDKPLRRGTAGETFKVLAYQPEQKKVFLAAKDPAGKELAVSVAEDCVSLVPADKAKVQADMLDAISREQYDGAKTLLDQALRSSPDDVDLHSISIALEAVTRRSAELNRASANQKSVEADLARRHRNADVTDHPNLLDPRDNSGHQRAAQMRSEASRIETQSNQALRVAQTDFDAALSALKSIIQRSPVRVAEMPSSLESRKPKGLMPKQTVLDKHEKLSSAAQSDLPRSAIRTENDLPNPLYDELRLPEAIRSYSAIEDNHDSASRYVFFYKQHALREPRYFDVPNWPSLLAQEVKDWDNLNFVNLRPIKTPKFSDYAQQKTDGLLEDHPVIFLKAIGELSGKSDGEILKLLADLNAAANTLQVSAVALAEYMEAWQTLYSQNGYEKGPFIARDLVDGFGSAARVWKDAKRDGDTVLEQADNCIDAVTNNTFVSQTSPYIRTCRNCAVMYLNMKNDELDAKLMGREFGELTVKDAFDAIKSARRKGDDEVAKQMVRRLLLILSTWKTE